MDTLASLSAAAGTTGNAAKAKSSIANTFDTFLTLLTAQLQNQDPLKPLDSTEFTNQLVQFTNVEQQIEQNKNLENLLSLQRSNAASSSVSYLGKSAVATTDNANLVGGKAVWNYELPSAATDVSLTVQDALGRTVAVGTGENAAGKHTFSWDGQSLNGQKLPDGGVYTLKIAATNGNGDPVKASITQQGLISGVDLSGSTPRLTIAGTQVDISAITSLTTTPL